MYYQNSTYLQHYGVKGMKWGVRKAVSKVGKGIKRTGMDLYTNTKRAAKHPGILTMSTIVGLSTASAAGPAAAVVAVGSTYVNSVAMTSLFNTGIDTVRRSVEARKGKKKFKKLIN